MTSWCPSQNKIRLFLCIDRACLQLYPDLQTLPSLGRPVSVLWLTRALLLQLHGHHLRVLRLSLALHSFLRTLSVTDCGLVLSDAVVLVAL